MYIENLFEQRSLVAEKLKKCLRDRGYTKVSFAKNADISRPTLDKVLNGSITNKSTYDKHIQKILDVLKLSAAELMSYSENTQHYVEAVYSKNAPTDFSMSEKAQAQYNLMMDIIDLCGIYYRGDHT